MLDAIVGVEETGCVCGGSDVEFTLGLYGSYGDVVLAMAEDVF